jgi:hypothetical protein
LRFRKTIELVPKAAVVYRTTLGTAVSAVNSFKRVMTKKTTAERRKWYDVRKVGHSNP